MSNWLKKITDRTREVLVRDNQRKAQDAGTPASGANAPVDMSGVDFDPPAADDKAPAEHQRPSMIAQLAGLDPNESALIDLNYDPKKGPRNLIQEIQESVDLSGGLIAARARAARPEGRQSLISQYVDQDETTRFDDGSLEIPLSSSPRTAAPAHRETHNQEPTRELPAPPAAAGGQHRDLHLEFEEESSFDTSAQPLPLSPEAADSFFIDEDSADNLDPWGDDESTGSIDLSEEPLLPAGQTTAIGPAIDEDNLRTVFLNPSKSVTSAPPVTAKMANSAGPPADEDDLRTVWLDTSKPLPAATHEDDLLRTVKLDAGTLLGAAAPPPLDPADFETPRPAAKDDSYLATVKLDVSALGLAKPAPTPPTQTIPPRLLDDKTGEQVTPPGPASAVPAPTRAVDGPSFGQQASPVQVLDQDDATRIGPSTSAPADAVCGWLVIVEGPGRGTFRHLGSGVNAIGRAPDNRVPLYFGGQSDAEVSRRDHVRVIYDPRNNQFKVQHGASRNLSYLNGEPVYETADLKPYDRINVGKTTLVFVPFCGEAFVW